MRQITILLLLLCLFECAKAEVVIQGKLTNIKVVENLYYHEPIDGFSNLTHNPKKIFLSTDSTFRIEFFIKKAGFIYLRLPETIMALFVRPNDTVSFTAHYILDTIQHRYNFRSAVYEGDNAKGHEVYCSNKAYSSLKDFLLKDIFLRKNNTVTNFFAACRFTLSLLLQPFDSLYRHQDISTDYYKTIIADISGSYVWNIMNLFGFLTKTKERINNKAINKELFNAVAANNDLFSKPYYDSLRLLIYRYFDPFDPYLLHSLIGPGLTDYYCQDLYEGIIKNDLPYDNSFSNFNKHNRHYGYLRGRFLEKLWAGQLYWDMSTEPDEDKLKTSYKMFSTYFPTSSFLPILQERLSDALGDNALVVSMSKDITVLETKQYNTLQELVKENFKSQYVFVDLWATWCTPCIQEFIYKNELKTFLNDKNIKLLYLSIDEVSTAAKWKSFINSKQLYGTHFFATEAFIADMKQQLYKGSNVTIPRYVLLNHNGGILDADLPRPSDLKALKEKIQSLIR